MTKKYIPDIKFVPVVEIHNENMDAHYYDDGSGEIALNYDNEEFFFKDDGKLKHQIEYIQEHIDQLEKIYKQQLNVCKKAKIKAKL